MDLGHVSKTIEDSIKGLTTCSTCIDIFIDPRSLPGCLHTFCLACLSEMCKNLLPGDQFDCPLCQTQHTIPDNGVTDFPKNFHLEEIKLLNWGVECRNTVFSDSARHDVFADRELAIRQEYEQKLVTVTEELRRTEAKNTELQEDIQRLNQSKRSLTAQKHLADTQQEGLQAELTKLIQENARLKSVAATSHYDFLNFCDRTAAPT